MRPPTSSWRSVWNGARTPTMSRAETAIISAETANTPGAAVTASSAPPMPGPSMYPALRNAPATLLARASSSSATRFGTAPWTAAVSAPWVHPAATVTRIVASTLPCQTSSAQTANPIEASPAEIMMTTRRSWRSPTCPVHGETAVAAPKIASMAPDSHQAEEVAE